MKAIKYRAEVAGIKENVWSTNALEFDTPEQAEAWLDNLSGRWFGFDMCRVVSTDIPVREQVDLVNNVFYKNFRKD